MEEELFEMLANRAHCILFIQQQKSKVLLMLAAGTSVSPPVQGSTDSCTLTFKIFLMIKTLKCLAPMINYEQNPCTVV